jgi:hypothetical protein
MKYLGVPILTVALKNSHLDFIDAKLERKLDAWVSNSMSSGGKKDFN